jgi:CheY-like chemotaxis protein
VEQLQQNGVRVDLTRSTQESLSRFFHRRYRVILSDMSRFENGPDVPDAGLCLLKAIRQTGQSVPLLIYCSPRAVQDYGDKALAAGATKVTASPYQVTEELRALELL